MSIVLKSFGRKVARLRREKGLTQEQLAEHSRLHRTYVGAIERGERNLGLENVAALAKAFQMPLAELFAGVRT